MQFLVLSFGATQEPILKNRGWGTKDGKALDAHWGPFKLVVTEDKRPARAVRNLVVLEVKIAE